MHITKFKKSVWKGYKLYDSIFMILWKRQINGHKNISHCQKSGGGRDEQSDIEVSSGSETSFGWHLMVDRCHHTVVQTHRMYNTKTEL